MIQVVWTEENAEREAFDRKEPCPLCGNYQPVGTGPCVFGCDPEPIVSHTIPVPVGLVCDDCGTTRGPRDWFHHRRGCHLFPRDAERTLRERERQAALLVHPVGKARLPARVYGTRVWNEHEERWEYPL